MKKTWFLLGISTLSLALFTGCAGNADTMPDSAPMVTTAPTTTTAPTQSAGPTVSISPQTTEGMDLLPDMDVSSGMIPETGVNTTEDAKRVSKSVADEVEKLSELDEAEAIVAGNIALVGISYDTQYQGGLTDRLRDMVTERVELVDKAITTVHVTEEEQQVMEISRLAEKLDADDLTFQELQTKVLEIGSTIAGSGMPNVSQPKTNTGV